MTTPPNAHRDLIQPLGSIRLHNGFLLSDVKVAYCSYGQLSGDGRNAILVTHGYTSSHHMLAHGDGAAEGSWGGLIGPGKALDTDKYFIICSNMLGSSYGTTGPNSINPSTGLPYGRAFPHITFSDIVDIQHALLSKLGIRSLRCVVGPSYGGFQALQWALSYSHMVQSIGVIVSGPYLPAHEQMDLVRMEKIFREDVSTPLTTSLFQWRRENLIAHGTLEVLKAQGVTEENRLKALEKQAWNWASTFNAQSLITLLRAGLEFDVRSQLKNVHCKALHILSTSDTLFPPIPGIEQPMLAIQGLRHVTLDTPFGHQASGIAHAQWSPLLIDLLEAVDSDERSIPVPS